MHDAKGREFRAVAVIACDADVLPSERRLLEASDERALKEIYDTERHLLYVAATRARERLWLSACPTGFGVPGRSSSVTSSVAGSAFLSFSHSLRAFQLILRGRGRRTPARRRAVSEPEAVGVEPVSNRRLLGLGMAACVKFSGKADHQRKTSRSQPS
ncbi:MAG: ATP-dependent helicase [Mesorhizobium sp.]|nr:MAG: ATP-dependent helicase [Mesorhizobium sp.]